MAVITVAAVRAALTKSGLLETTKNPDPTKLKKGQNYFASPSSSGKEFIVYLSDQYQKGDRRKYLQELATKLSSLKGKYAMKAGGSTAGAVTFSSSTIYIIAKMFKTNSASINKGILFEKNLEKDLKTYVKGGINFQYRDFINEFTQSLGTDDILDVSAFGALNTSRPLASDGKSLYVSVKGRARSENIGFSIADLVVKTKKGKKIPLSLKYGSTVTFFNSGVTKFFSMEDFKKADFTRDPVARNIFKLFGLDPKLFRDSFMNYVEPTEGEKRKSEKTTVSVKINVHEMKDFIKTVIGHGYYLVHEHNNGHVQFYNMTAAFLEKAATPDSNMITILYPKGGTAKRVDILVSTSVFNLKFNIRNKQGGILPSHMMCDYSFK